MTRRPPAVPPTRPMSGWCQTRITPALARAVAQLPIGVKGAAVRSTLYALCAAHGIPIDATAEPSD